MRFETYAPAPVFVDTSDDVETCIRHCSTSDMLGGDTETLGLLKNPDTGRRYDKMTDQVVVMGLSPDEDSRYLVPRRNLHHFQGLMANPNIPKAFTNIKFDAHRLKNTANIDLAGPWVDTVVLDFLLDEDTRENKHGLKACAKDYFGINMVEYKDLFGKLDPREMNPKHADWPKYLDYGSLDPWVTRKLALLLLSQLRRIYVWGAEPQEELSEYEREFTMADLYWATEEPQLKALYGMERRGIKVDVNRLAEIGDSLKAEMDSIARELNKMVGRPFNPNSGPQIGEYLFEDLGLKPLGYTPGGQYKTDKKTLEHYAYGEDQVEACGLILKYKKASKLKGTYAEGLLKWAHTDGRIHTTYSPTKTTGRLGSSDPNIQNVPRPDNDPHGIRAAFIPDEGKKFIVADYGQLEMRIMAYAAMTYGDSTMLQAILDGLDMHCFTAAKMNESDYGDFFEAAKVREEPWAVGLRTAAKAVGFGIIYGIGAQGLSAQLTQALGRFVSEAEAQGYINMYLAAFPGVKLYMADKKSMARNLGYVQTLCGRFRRLSNARSKNGAKRGHALRQSINAPIQGSAADIVKRAMLLCVGDARLAELGWVLLHQVHDELIFEGPEESAEEALEIIQAYMEHPFTKDLPVPLIAEPCICNNWKEGK
jgi:DNA polymerase-1